MSTAPSENDLRPSNAGSNPNWLAGLERSMKGELAGKDDIGSKLDAVQKVNTYLEQRSRLLSTIIRLMEQQRQHFRSMEAEREAAYAKLTAAMAMVQETGRSAASAVGGDAKPGDASVEMMFEKNRKALDELENVSIALRANYLSWRAAWEQYAATREKGKTIRTEMADSPQY